MRRVEKTVFLSLLALLALVAVLYGVQTVRSSRPARVYQISAICGQQSDSGEKGINSAALAYSADVHTVNVMGGAPEDQLTALSRELESGVDGVILVQCDGSVLGDWLKAHPPDVPVVAVGDGTIAGSGVVNVTADNQALGTLLGEAIASDGADTKAMLVVERTGEAVSRREAALSASLAAAGIELNVIPLEKVFYPGAPGIIIAADPLVAEKLIVEAPEGAALYGFGYRPTLRGACESGRLDGLAVVSEYDAGYLALQSAVSLIGGQREANALLPAFLVRPETMYQSPASTILFPIE